MDISNKNVSPDKKKNPEKMKKSFRFCRPLLSCSWGHHEHLNTEIISFYTYKSYPFSHRFLMKLNGHLLMDSSADSKSYTFVSEIGVFSQVSLLLLFV